MTLTLTLSGGKMEQPSAVTGYRVDCQANATAGFSASWPMILPLLGGEARGEVEPSIQIVWHFFSTGGHYLMDG